MTTPPRPSTATSADTPSRSGVRFVGGGAADRVCHPDGDPGLEAIGIIWVGGTCPDSGAPHRAQKVSLSSLVTAPQAGFGHPLAIFGPSDALTAPGALAL